MKKALLYFLLIIFISPIYAQNAESKFSQKIKLPNRKFLQEHLYSDTDGNHYVYYYELGGTGFYGERLVSNLFIEKYNKDFELIFEKKYDLESNNNLYSRGLTYFNGKFLWIVLEDNWKKNTIQYSVQPIDLDGKKEDKIEVLTISYKNIFDIPNLTWQISPDLSKLLIHLVKDREIKDKNATVFSFVINEKFEKLWSENYDLGHSAQLLDLLDTKVDNEGKVHILSKIYTARDVGESKRENGKEIRNYEISLIQLTNNQKTPNMIKINMDTVFIRSGHLRFDKNNSLNCIAYYSNGVTSAIQGIFFLKIDKNGTVLISRKNEFRDQDLKVLGEKNLDKDKKAGVGLDDIYKINEVFIHDDNSFVVVSENNDAVSGSGTASTGTYYSNDIIIFMISALGDLERITRIPKFQENLGNNGPQSYLYMSRGKDIAFVYNETEANLSKPVTNSDNNWINNASTNYVVLTTLKRDGSFERISAFNSKDAEVIFWPKKSKQIESDKLFFVAQKFKFGGKIELKIGTITIRS